MSFSLSYNAIKLLKFVLSCTGEKELDERGQEIQSPRRLNGEESSQRRLYFKAINEIEKTVETALNELVKSHNEKVNAQKEILKTSFLKKEDQSDKDYEDYLNLMLNNDQNLVESLNQIKKGSQQLMETKQVVEIGEKVLDVLKKYFVEFGEKVGYVTGDDEVIAELEEVLK